MSDCPSPPWERSKCDFTWPGNNLQPVIGNTVLLGARESESCFPVGSVCIGDLFTNSGQHSHTFPRKLIHPQMQNTSNVAIAK